MNWKYIILSLFLIPQLLFSQKIATSLLDQKGETEFLIIVHDPQRQKVIAPNGTKFQKARAIHQQLQARAKRTQSNLLHFLHQQNTPHKALSIVNLIWTKGDQNLMQKLAKRKDVAKIIANPSTPFEQPTLVEENIERRSAIEWGIINLRADQVWEMGHHGAGVVVAGQDTGYEWEHPALIEKYRGNKTGSVDHNYNWHDAIREINPMNDTINDPNLNPCGFDSSFPCDDNNHGTHTMGIAIGEDSTSQIGVAPEADWIGCRNMERGYGTPFTYLECFEWFLAPTNLQNENPRPDLAPHVIINSWGCPPIEGCTSDNFALLQEAVDNLKASGVMVVASAGNSGRSGCSTIDDPAAIFDNSFSVGAIARNDTIADFSSRGPVTVDGSNLLKPNVVAPGVNVRSAIRGGRFANFSGTSMSGPQVAGVVALMISANPSLAGQVEEIETILEQTARATIAEESCDSMNIEEIPNNTYGYGKIDALAAVEMALDFSSTTNIKTSTFEVFPNPSEHLFTIRTSSRAARRIRIFNGKGQLILEQNWTNSIQTNINLSRFPQGIYFYEIFEEGEIVRGKLIKK